MLALDLFCGAGGVAMGLHRAGFDVVGVDIKPQPHYPFTFIQGDATRPPVDVSKFDFIWASPPCQAYTRMAQGLLRSQGRGRKYPDHVAATRRMLTDSGRPFVIENVPGAPLLNAFMLCGSQFGLLVQRHRLFEASFAMLVPQCLHHNYVADKPALHRLHGVSRVVGCYGNGRGKGDNLTLWRKAMGIDWMTRKELSQAIPPAYSEFIGKAAMQSLSQETP